MTEPEIEIFHQMLLRCDDIAGKLDYFDVNESLWQHSPYIRDSFLISVSQIGELVSKISPETLLKNDDIRREYESTLVVEEDIEEDILGYFGALDPIVGDGADGRIPQDGNRP